MTVAHDLDQERAALTMIQPEPFNAEAPPEALAREITPTRLHYVRSNFALPEHDGILEIAGAVEIPATLTLADLRALPSAERVVTLECAGNGRLGQTPLPAGEPFGSYAVSAARWKGAFLHEVLQRARPVPHVFDTGGDVFHRTDDRLPPNNLFTGGAQVQRAVESASLTPAGLPRASVPIASGPAAPAVDVSEHGSAYAFDPATRTYTKQVDGGTLTDAATGQPLRIQLLVVLHTTATPTGYVEDVNGQQGLDFDVESGGRADYVFDGLQATGRWSSPGPDMPLQFWLDGGATVTPPPLTWIDVVTA